MFGLKLTGTGPYSVPAQCHAVVLEGLLSQVHEKLTAGSKLVLMRCSLKSGMVFLTSIILSSCKIIALF